MESRLQCRQSVIFEHVQQCLYRMLLVEISQETFKLDIPSFRHYPTQGREFLRSCAPNLEVRVSMLVFPLSTLADSPSCARISQNQLIMNMVAEKEE